MRRISTSANQTRQIQSGKSDFFYSPNTLTTFTSVFESTIRYIGGLLSAYELSGKQYPALVNKAKQLADKLSFAWVGVRIILTCLNITV